MNGFEAVKRIRIWEAEGRIPHQAVIALTGNARQWQIDQAMEAGMDDGKSFATYLRHR
jgi:CheY-like chemotaxis protein